MAINTYSTLLTAVENWSANTTQTDRIEEFVALCENTMWYGQGERGDAIYSEPLRIKQMETSGDLTISTSTVAQPTGYLSSRRLYINSSPIRDVDYYPPDTFWQSWQAQLQTTATPTIYTEEGTNFRFAASPDQTYTGKILYYGKLTALSTSNETNWIIQNAPNIYLYGTLLQFYIYTRNDKETQKYAALYSGSVNALNTQDKTSSHSGSDLSQIPDNKA